MNDTRWSPTGYVTEIPYLRAVLRYQSPILMSLAAHWAGHGAPDPRNRFHYLDLGCGEAVTLLVLAASYPHAEFVGVDLNAAHIASARALADAAELTNVTLIEGDFEDARLRESGPFDYIAAHGVYSWVAPEVQQGLTRLVGEALAPGGLFYMCHFVRPGGGKMELLFQLIQSYMTGNGPLEEQIRAAVNRIEGLARHGTPLAARIPDLEDELNALRNRDPRYLVHEFGNRHFAPRYLAEVVDDFAAEGLSLAGTTRLDRAERRFMFSYSPPRVSPGVQGEIESSLALFDAFRWDLFVKPGEQRSGPVHTPFGDFHLGATVFPYRFPSKTTLWEREVSLDTDSFRRFAGLARDGTRTWPEILAEVPQPEREGVAEAAKYGLAARLFVPLLTSPEPTQAKPDARYRLAHPLSLRLWERDALSEGALGLPSAITGAPFFVTGFATLAIGFLHEQTLEAAAGRIRQRIEDLDAPTRKRLRLADPWESDSFNTHWRQFVAHDLPLLLKYGVVEADS